MQDEPKRNKVEKIKQEVKYRLGHVQGVEIELQGYYKRIGQSRANYKQEDTCIEQDKASHNDVACLFVFATNLLGKCGGKVTSMTLFYYTLNPLGHGS